MTTRCLSVAALAALSASAVFADDARLRSLDPAVRAGAAEERVSIALAVEGESAGEAEHRLVELGKTSPEIVSSLIRRVKARETQYRQRSAAGRMLTQIGAPAATPELLEAMHETYCPVPAVFMRILRDMGTPAYPLIVQGMRNENPRIRARCSYALSFRARTDPTAAALLAAFRSQAALMPKLGDADPQTRLAASTDLAKLAVAEPLLAGASFDALVAAAVTPAISTDYDAALIEVALKSPESAGKMIKMLRGDDRPRRTTALRVLPKLGSALSNPAMSAALGDDYCPLPYMLRRVLIAAGPDAVEVVRVGLNHPMMETRHIAVQVISGWARSKDAKVAGDVRVAAAMVEALRNSDPEIRMSAARAAGNSPRSEPVLAALLKALDDHDTQVQNAAVASLRTIGRQSTN